MQSPPIAVGIAGLGRSGWDIHARLLEPLSEMYRITAVVDASPERRQEAVERFDCLAYTEFAQLLTDPGVELIVVALPSFLHADCSIAALEAGKHVVCEKPMADSLEAADRMVAAAQASDRVLTIFQNRRYNPDFRKVKALLDAGLLGRIVQIRLTASGFGRRWDWQTLKRFGGGSLNNTGPHFLDMALQLFGPADPEEIFVHLDRTLTLGDADDHVKLVFKAPGAPTVDIEISACDAFPNEMWHIMGTQGGLKGNGRSLRWRFFDPVELPPRELSTEPTPGRSYNRDEIPWQEGSWQAEQPAGEAHREFYRDLYRTIRQNAPLQVTPESVRRVVWLQEKCHQLGGL